MFSIRDCIDAAQIKTVSVSDIMKRYPYSKKTFRGKRIYILTTKQCCDVIKMVPNYFPKFSTSIDTIHLEDGIKQMNIHVRDRVLEIYFEERAN